MLRNLLYKSFFGLLLGWVLSGCAVMGSSPYPSYPDGVKVFISNETVPRTQTTGGDHHVDDSQVYITSDSRLEKHCNCDPGVLGFIYFAIDNARNTSLVEDIQSELKVKFDKTLKEELQSYIYNKSNAAQSIILASDSNSNVRLYPYATLDIQPNKQVKISFSVEVRYSGMYRKWYHYTYPSLYPLSGEKSLTENGASLIHLLSNKAFKMVAEAAMDDILNRLPQPEISDKFVYFYRENDKEKRPFILLRRYSNFVVSTPVGDGQFLGAAKIIFDDSVKLAVF